MNIKLLIILIVIGVYFLVIITIGLIMVIKGAKIARTSPKRKYEKPVVMTFEDILKPDEDCSAGAQFPRQ
jgi:hypothetical protein